MSPQDLLSRHQDLWDRATRHPFLEGVRDGTLPQEAFSRWLVQDYWFVRGLLQAQAQILAGAPRRDQKVLASGLLALAEELDWFEGSAGSRNLSLDEPLQPAASEYVGFLRGLFREPYPAQITALWACERAYRDAWSAAAPGAPQYREFVERWTHPAFADYVTRLEASAGYALQEASSCELAAAEQAFQRVAEFESAFWEMAWRGGQR